MRRRAYLVGAGAALGSLAGCIGASGSSVDPDEYDVGMASNRFLPEEFEVEVGGTVVWANTGSRNHTVTAYQGSLPAGAAYFASGGFESEEAARAGWQNGLEGAVLPDETFEHTFEVAGDYPYVCIPHEFGGMVGTIVVTE